MAAAAQDAELFGFPEELVRQIAKNEGQGEVEVWPENWSTVCAFAAVFSQWRAVPRARGGAHFIGLDYSGVRAGLDAEGFPVTPELWTGIRVMEAEARDALNSGA